MQKRMFKFLPALLSLALLCSLALSPMVSAADSGAGEDEGTESIANAMVAEGGDGGNGLENPAPEPEPEPGDEDDGDEGNGDPGWGGDTTPPVIKSFAPLTTEISTPGTVVFEIDLVEEESGVSSIELWYYNENGDNFWLSYSDSDLLYTGTNTVEIHTWSSVPLGTYTLGNVTITDYIGNPKQYSYDVEEGVLYDVQLGTTAQAVGWLEVTSTDWEDWEQFEAPYITDFKLLTPEIESPGTFSVELELEPGSEGQEVYRVGIWMAYSVNEERTLSSSFYSYLDVENQTAEGSLVVEFDSHESVLPEGEVWVSGISLAAADGSYIDANYSYRDYFYDDGLEAYVDNTSESVINMNKVYGTVVNSDYVPDIDAPKIKSLEMLETDIEIPGVLEIEIDLEEEGSGLLNIMFNYRYIMSDGSYADKTFGANFYDDPLFSGKHVISVPFSLLMPSTTYFLVDVSASDMAGNYAFYMASDAMDVDNTEFKNGEDSFHCERTINLTNNYNILFNTKNDGSLADKIENLLTEGSTATVDTNENSVVDGDVFEALAGADKTVIFYNENSNVQWVFNGLDIEEGKGKDVDLYLWPQNDAGYELGMYESPAVKLEFADNGELPGKATIRMYTDELNRMHQNAEDGILYLNYYGTREEFYQEGNREPIGEPIPVRQEGDLYSVFTVEHNSIYFITESETPEPDGFGPTIISAKVLSEEITVPGELIMELELEAGSRDDLIRHVEISLPYTLPGSTNTYWTYAYAYFKDGLSSGGKHTLSFKIEGRLPVGEVQIDTLELYNPDGLGHTYTYNEELGAFESKTHSFASEKLVAVVKDTGGSSTSKPDSSSSGGSSSSSGGSSSNGGSSSSSSAKPSYKVVEGGNTIYKGGGKGVTIKVDAPFGEFKAVRVGGITLEKDKHYTVTEGSTIVVLLEEYLFTLENGKQYTVDIVFDSLTVQDSFWLNFTEVITPETEDTAQGNNNAIANTGDAAAPMWQYVMLAALAAMAGLAVCGMRFMRKRGNGNANQ